METRVESRPAEVPLSENGVSDALPGHPDFDFVREKAGIREFRLRSNGLQTLLLSNDVAPVATFAVVYRVGSRNEAVGHTGATHLLEHLMFKGTPEFDREKGTAIAAVLEALGARFNATTWFDRTNYYETVPSDSIETAVRIEASRMRGALLRDSDRVCPRDVPVLVSAANDVVQVGVVHAGAGITVVASSSGRAELSRPTPGALTPFVRSRTKLPALGLLVT